MASILALNPDDKIGVYVQSNAPYLEMLHSTSFTLKYLIPLEPLPFGFSMRLKEPLTVNVYGDYQTVGWRAIDNGQYKKESEGKDGEYTIGKTGLYLVAVNIEFNEVEGLSKAIPSLNNIPALGAAYKAPQEQTFTISVSGVMYIQAGSTFTVIAYTESDQFYKLSDKSTSSMTFIGDTSIGFTSYTTFKHSLIEKNIYECLPLKKFWQELQNKILLFFLATILMSWLSMRVLSSLLVRRLKGRLRN